MEDPPVPRPSSTGFCEQSWDPLSFVSAVYSVTEMVLLDLSVR